VTLSFTNTFDVSLPLAMDNRKHFTAGLIAFFMWGFFAFPLRAVSDYESGQILYFRILFSLLILSFVILVFKRRQWVEEQRLFRQFSKKKQRSVVVLTLVGGLLLTINWLTFIHIVNHINIKTASFSYLICPVLTAVLGSVLLKEKLSKLQWLAVVICALSCVLIGYGSVVELLFSLLTAFTYALYLITQRRNQGFDRVLILGIQILFACSVLTLVYPVLVSTLPTEFAFYGWILVIAVFFTVVPLFLNLYALNRVNAATIGIMMYINPMLNFCVAVLFFNETVSSLQLLGYLSILLALILFNASLIKRVYTSSSAK
jgi:chloramphenicol-sensitive protein RarD